MALAANSIEGRSKPFVARIETMLSRLDSMRGTYMAECREVRGDIKEIYTEAKDKGVPVKALKGLIKYRELERKQSKIGDGLDIDEASAYQNLVEAIGPLGEAAAKAAGFANGDDDADLRPTALKEAEKERADESALAQVGKGKEPAAAH